MSNNNHQSNTLGQIPRIFWGNRPLNLNDLQNRIKPRHLVEHPITLENGQALPLNVLAYLLELPPDSVDLVEVMKECSNEDFLDMAQTVRSFHKMDNVDEEFANFLKHIGSLSEEEVAKLEAQEQQQRQQPKQQQQLQQPLNHAMSQNPSLMNNMMMMMNDDNPTNQQSRQQNIQKLKNAQL